MKKFLLGLYSPAFFLCNLLLLSPGLFASGQNHSLISSFYYTGIPSSYQERIFAWMRYSYINANSDFSNAFRNNEDFRYSSYVYEATDMFDRNENPSVANSSGYAAEEVAETEKILVVLVDAYGTQNYSKVIITDVDMEESILIAKDLFEKLPHGIYTVVASSANDLISQKLIIQ